ncbi:hypothetical protein FB451DRAFT_1032103, partial [Mycena latifolia]
CSIFCPWQGWMSMSSTGPEEGMLCVLPMLSLAMAYWMLHPFFCTCDPTCSSLRWEDWNELNLDAPEFPGSQMGTGKELKYVTHPHLQLERTMISMPHVEPGDQVYCMCCPTSSFLLFLVVFT